MNALTGMASQVTAFGCEAEIKLNRASVSGLHATDNYLLDYLFCLADQFTQNHDKDHMGQHANMNACIYGASIL